MAKLEQINKLRNSLNRPINLFNLKYSEILLVIEKHC